MQVFEHPVTICLAGPGLLGAAEILRRRVSPHAVATVPAAGDAVSLGQTRAEAAGTVQVLAADLDDEVRNYAPGDLYVKVRCPRPDDFLRTAIKGGRVAVAVVEITDRTSVDSDLKALAGHECQRLLIVPASRLPDAVHAINAGLAEAVLIAGSYDGATLTRQVERLIARYFERAGAALRQALNVNGIRFFDEPSVVQAIETGKRDFGATGFICTADPPGVMMINPRGELAFLLVSDDSYATSCAEIADAERGALNSNAPAHFAEETSGPAGPRQAWMAIVAGADRRPGSSWRTTMIIRDYTNAAVFDGIIAPPA